MVVNVDIVSHESLKTSPSADTIRLILRKTSSSSVFRSKKRMCQLLEYLVEETLGGRVDNLKGYTIAIDVFKRDQDFDSNLDPIVRIQIGRLRRTLQQYYNGEGKNDKLHIYIPKGTYVPQFIPAEIEELSSEQSKESSISGSFSQRFPTIAVLPFVNLTGNPEKNYFAAGFAEEISIELTHYEDFQVIACRSAENINKKKYDLGLLIEKPNSQFLVEGSVRLKEKDVKISVKLTNIQTNEHLWGEQYFRELTANNLVSMQEEISQQVISKIAGEYGIIPRDFLKVFKKKKVAELETYDAMLRYYYYQTQHTPEATNRAFNALKYAVENDPDSGVIRAMIATMYASIYMIDLPDAEKSKELGVFYAQKAFVLDPYNQLVRIVLASTHFMCSKKELFFNEIENALSLNPNSPLRIGAIGFYLCLYGDWDRGKLLLDKAMKYNARIPSWYYGATTLYYYRSNDFKKAYQEALKYDVGTMFWGPMLRIACLGQLQRTAEIKANLEHLKTLKPDFENEASYLISRYVKEEKLVDQIIEGLRKAGLDIPNI